MKRKPYKRKPGDLEIRVLPDGRLAMIAPDEALSEIAQAFTSKTSPQKQNLENIKHGKARTAKT
jgi:hypothetical protein